jgi:hypothetical protein
MIPARILARLVPEPNTGCLLWDGGTDRKGYAVCWFEGKRRRVNRVLHFLRTGEWLPVDVEVMHSCDTPSCCDERHTKPGTRAENARDRQRKGRTRGARTYPIGCEA